MSTQANLPVMQSVKQAFQWGGYVIAGHPVFFIALVLVSFAVQLSYWWMGGKPDVLLALLVILLYVANGLGLLALVLVTHNEVLRGQSDFGAATLGRGGGRIFTYLLDLLAVSVLVALSVAASMLLVVPVGMGLHATMLPEGALVVFFALFYVAMFGVYVGVTARLMLRLPSRAIGQPLRWGRVWALGRNNTLRLIGANALVFLIFLVPVLVILLGAGALVGGDIGRIQSFLGQFAAEHFRPNGTIFHGPPSLALALMAGLNALLTPIELVVFAAFYSIAYARLIGNLQAEPQGFVSA